MAWRTAHALDTLRVEINLRWPDRSKVSDGTIGDAAHASRTSDHNPWVVVNGVGVVRAFDCTAVGIDANGYAEYLRGLGKAGDPRLTGGGYVIWNKRIASEKQGWAWRRYTGSNGHTHHIHLSLSTKPAGFDSRASWGINSIGRPPLPPPPARTFKQYAKGATDATIAAKGGLLKQVTDLQKALAKLGFYRAKVDGVYGPITVSAVIAFKAAATWRNRSSVVDVELDAAIRALAAVK